MNFRIADTFTDTLTYLTGNEQKAVGTTAFDVQMNPANANMRFFKLQRDQYWSRIAVKVINHFSDEVMKVFKVAGDET